MSQTSLKQKKQKQGKLSMCTLFPNRSRTALPGFCKCREKLEPLQGKALARVLVRVYSETQLLPPEG